LVEKKKQVKKLARADLDAVGGNRFEGTKSQRRLSKRKRAKRRNILGPKQKWG